MSFTPVSDAPLSFEPFKKYHDFSAPPHRRLYVIHAHTYFQYTTDAEKAKAQEVHAAIQAEFAGNSGVEQHTSQALWLGEKTGMNLPPLAKAQQQVRNEVANGGDEASLLWKFA